jgi:hypothetical protein
LAVLVQDHGGAAPVGGSTTLNVLNARQRAVQALFLDALGRPGSLAELTVWANMLPVGATALTTAVVSDIEGSFEARDHLVKSWYITYLGRQAQGGEEQTFVQLLLAGHPEEQVLSLILGVGGEFYARAQTLGFGGTADQNYVQALYHLVLGRTGSAGEVNGWVNALPAIGRQGAALLLLQGPEFRTDTVARYYQTLLHRPADQSSLNNWVSSGFDLPTVRIDLEASAEFFLDG